MMGLRECGPRSSWRENPGSAPTLNMSTAQEEAAFRGGMGFSLLLAISYLQPWPASGDRGGP